jgi:hypothetical protein
MYKKEGCAEVKGISQRSPRMMISAAEAQWGATGQVLPCNEAVVQDCSPSSACCLADML